MSKTNIVAAISADVEPIADFLCQPQMFPQPSIALSRTRVQKSLDRTLSLALDSPPSAIFLVAKDHGYVGGYIIARTKKYNNSTAEIEIGVACTKWRSGLGRLLFASLLAVCTEYRAVQF